VPGYPGNPDRLYSPNLSVPDGGLPQTLHVECGRRLNVTDAIQLARHSTGV